MFVVCGEALMDVFTGDDHAEGLTMEARIGGSPFNVARGLARLGQPVAFLGGVSQGRLGQRLLQALRAEGIDERCVVPLPNPTTLSLVALDAQGTADYAFYGQDGADRALRAEQLPPLPADTQALHFGSYTMVVEPVASALQALARAQRPYCLISYDPNVRLNVEPARALWRQRIDEMAALAHVVKVSDEDLALLEADATPAEVAQRWLQAGCQLVVVTAGSRGATAWRAGECLQVDAVPTTVVDTVGAGDTFQAALLTALAERGACHAAGLRDLPAAALKDVLHFAARAAALTCSRRGADLPHRAMLG